MNYGRLIQQAWSLTWRYRFLWLLGILAGGGVGLPALNGNASGSGWRVGSGELGPPNPQVAKWTSDVSAWAVANVGQLITAGLLCVVLLVTLLILSLIAQGGMARATVDLASGRSCTLSSAWQAGRQLFWRYVGLWLVLVGAAAMVASVIAVMVAAIIAYAPFGLLLALLVAAAALFAFVHVILRMSESWSAPRWLIGLGATVLALPLFTILIVAALTGSIVLAHAQRAIAAEDVGPVAALRSGWRLLRLHIGESLLAWLINVALAIGAAIAFVAGVLSALLALLGVGAAIWAAAGFDTPTFVYMGLPALALLAVGLTLVGVANTFFWNYWTLAYLRLSGRAPATG
ncbi:MAG TPA: hypothetical protein VGL99_16685 [Chloroflexota bacterium]